MALSAINISKALDSMMNWHETRDGRDWPGSNEGILGGYYVVVAIAVVKQGCIRLLDRQPDNVMQQNSTLEHPEGHRNKETP